MLGTHQMGVVMPGRLSSRSFAFIAVASGLLLTASASHASPSVDRSQSEPAPIQVITSDDIRGSSALEVDVLAEINRVRTDPAGYAASLRGSDVHFRERDIENAIEVLQTRTPIAPLSFDPNLSGVAISHADYLGPLGLLSHTGYGGSTIGTRYRGQGWIATLPAEELTVGRPVARQLVMNLVIDAGVAGQPHLRDLINPVFTFAGVGCAPHQTYGQVCVIDLSNPPMAHREWIEAMFADDLGGAKPGWRVKPAPAVSTPADDAAGLGPDYDFGQFGPSPTPAEIDWSRNLTAPGSVLITPALSPIRITGASGPLEGFSAQSLMLSGLIDFGDDDSPLEAGDPSPPETPEMSPEPGFPARDSAYEPAPDDPVIEDGTPM